MEWLNDARQARAGDAAAKERLGEYLTPFVHGVALAHAPHHVSDPLVPRILSEALAGLSTVSDDQQVGPHFAAVARRLARAAATTARDEVAGDSPQLTEARQTLAKLRTLPEATRERLLLRVVEGIPGPELAAVLRVMEGELKTDLSRGAAEAARLLGHPAPPPGDAYLWELVGAPPPLLARLELQLPVLRYDGAAPPAPAAPPSSAATFLNLGPVGEGRVPTVTAAPPSAFPTDDETTSAHLDPASVTTAPGGVEKTRGASELPPQAQVNPFEPAVPTMAATDLPVAAQGVVPKVPAGPPSRSNAKLAPPTATARSSPSRPPVPDKPRSGLMGFSEPDETKAEVPPALARAQQRAASGADGGTDTAVPLVAQETRVQLPPVAAPALRGEAPAVGAEPEPTRMQPMPSAPPRPIPPLTPRSLLVGATPFVLAAGLLVAGLLAGWTGLFTSESQMKRAWTLVPVVVAAADMYEGDQLTAEAVAVRQMPDTVVRSASFVKPDSVAFVLGQRLIAPMQEGDPLCWTHLSDLEHSRRLSVQKRGRGYTIPTSVISSIGRHLKPGDRVDVVVSIEAPLRLTRGWRPAPRKVEKGRRSSPAPAAKAEAEPTEPVAVTVLQNVLVLATGAVLPTTRASSLDSKALAYTNVSVLVLPEEVEALALAQSLGRLTLTLRTEEDQELLDPAHREWTNINTLITGDRTSRLHKRRAEIIKIIRGETR